MPASSPEPATPPIPPVPLPPAFFAAAAAHYAYAVNAAVVDQQHATPEGAVHLVAANVPAARRPRSVPEQVGAGDALSAGRRMRRRPPRLARRRPGVAAKRGPDALSRRTPSGPHKRRRTPAPALPPRAQACSRPNELCRAAPRWMPCHLAAESPHPAASSGRASRWAAGRRRVPRRRRSDGARCWRTRGCWARCGRMHGELPGAVAGAFSVI